MARIVALSWLLYVAALGLTYLWVTRGIARFFRQDAVPSASDLSRVMRERARWTDNAIWIATGILLTYPILSFAPRALSSTYSLAAKGIWILSCVALPILLMVYLVPRYLVWRHNASVDEPLDIADRPAGS